VTKRFFSIHPKSPDGAVNCLNLVGNLWEGVAAGIGVKQ